MGSVRVPATDLVRFAAALLAAAGAPPDPARMTAELLVRADLAGHGSHGIRLLPYYCASCRSGEIEPAAAPSIERDHGATVQLDGNRSLGQVAGAAAVDLAIERARLNGVAVVTIRSCGHLGRLADYVERAAEEGFVALLAANDSGVNRVVAPYGSDVGRLATNPIAVGIPRRKPPHLVLDMATSVVSHGTLEVAQLAGDAAEPSWTTPAAALRPLGGAKGTGLALVVEVLGGILSGAGFSGGPSGNGPGYAYQGVWLLVLDPGRFLAPWQLETEAEQLVAFVKDAPPTPGAEVLVPGERSARATAANREAGTPVPEPVWAELLALAAQTGVEPPTATDRKDPR